MSTTDYVLHTPAGDIRVRDSSGLGMPLIMLHGSGSSCDVFARQFESSLSDIFRLVAIDLPGHGRSTNASDPAVTYSISGMAAAVASVIDQLRIENAAVLGWSLGGHVAIELMSFHKAVAGLMLCGTPPVGHGPLASLRGFHANWDMLLASKEVFSQRDAERFARSAFGTNPPPGAIEAILRTDGRVRSTFVRSMMRGDGVDQKRAVETAGIPIAIILGANDPTVRLNYVAGLRYDYLWDDKCHVIPGAGHAAFWDAPETFNRLIHRFLWDVTIADSQRIGAAEARRA